MAVMMSAQDGRACGGSRRATAAMGLDEMEGVGGGICLDGASAV